MAWSYAFTAQAGPDKSTCQDAVAIRPLPDGLAIAVSDGAGSAKHGAEAATLVAQSALELIDEPPAELLAELKCRLKQAASGDALAEFSCTLVMAVVRSDRIAFWQIGDGGAVMRSGESLTWLGLEGGEYMNVTSFVHEASDVFHREISGPVDAVGVFSDGLQHLVVDPISAEIHRPFFDRVFGVPNQPGHDERASAWLTQMALSDPVRKRTDDDIGIAVARQVET